MSDTRPAAAGDGSPLDDMPAAEAPPQRWSVRDYFRELRADLAHIDWATVQSLFVREALLTVRSRLWPQLLFWFTASVGILALLPAFYRTVPGRWSHPGSHQWLVLWIVGTVLGLIAVIAWWTRQRISRELRGGAFEEILLTGSSPADILLAKALAAGVGAIFLTLAATPACLFACAAAGLGATEYLRLSVTLAVVAYTGLCIGVEAGFRKPGATSFFHEAWSTANRCWMIAVLAAGYSGPGNTALRWLGYPKQWIVTYGPASLLLFQGRFANRWVVSLTLTATFLIILTLVNLRLLKRERPQAAELLDEESLWSQTLALRPVRESTTHIVEWYPGNPLANVERVLGYRNRIAPWFWQVLLVLLLAILAMPWSSVGRFLFAAFLWAACLLAAHNGCAPLAREREIDHWRELALTRLTDAELLQGKLLPGHGSWLGPARIAGVGLVQALLWSTIAEKNPAWAWGLWAGVTLLALPRASHMLGAALGARAPTSAAGRWRVDCLFALLPILMMSAAFGGLPVGWLTALSPLVPAAQAVAQPSVGPEAWAATGLYVAAGAAARWVLTHHLRAVVLPRQ